MFVIFGGLHGIGLVINYCWRKMKVKLNTLLSWFITFNFINITFIFFRANNLGDASKVLNGMFSINMASNVDFIQLAYFGLFFLIIFLPNSNEIMKTKLPKNLVIFATSFLFIISLLQLTNILVQSDKISEFLYFNF